MKEKVHEELKRHFRPEFLNRIDEVIVFHELTPGRGHRDRRPADQAGAGPARGPGPRPRAHATTPSCCSPRRATTRTLGARPLRRAIQRLVEDPLSEKILWKEFHAGETIVVDALDDEIVFRADRGHRAAAGRARRKRLRGLDRPPSILRPRTARGPAGSGWSSSRWRVMLLARGVQGRHHGHVTVHDDGSGVGHRHGSARPRRGEGGRGGRRRSSRTGCASRDLTDAGWTVAAVGAPRPTGRRRSRCRSRSRRRIRWPGIMRELNGADGPLRDVPRDARPRCSFSTSYSATGSLDLEELQTGLTADPDAGRGRCTSQSVDVDAIDQSLLADIREAFGFAGGGRAARRHHRRSTARAGTDGARSTRRRRCSTRQRDRCVTIVASRSVVARDRCVVLWPSRRRRRTACSSSSRDVQPRRELRPASRGPSSRPRRAAPPPDADPS